MSRTTMLYDEFFREVVELARKRQYTGIRLDVEWGNNPSVRLEWAPPVAEKFATIELRRG